MDLVLLMHAAATWALCGLIWTVQLVIYPQFERVGSEAFSAYHAAHMKRITWVVAPLMFAELGTAIWLLFREQGSEGALLLSFVFLALNWASTALVQVPLHQQLEREGGDVRTCQKLTLSNWIRTAGWTIRAILVVFVMT